MEQHLSLVPPIARRVHRRLPPSFDLDDLIGEGFVGLMHAAQRYRPQAHGGTPFSAFARPRIHGAIVDSVRRRAWVENTANPLDDAPEGTQAPSLPYLISGPVLAGPKPRGPGRPSATFRSNHLPKPLARALRELSARQRAILGAFYGDAGTLTEIAQMLHLSPAQATAEHAAALNTLRSVLVRNVSISGLDPDLFLVEKKAA